MLFQLLLAARIAGLGAPSLHLQRARDRDLCSHGFSLCPPLMKKTLMVTLRAHPDDLGLLSPHHDSNLIASVRFVLPCEVTFVGSRNSDVDIFRELLFSCRPLNLSVYIS